MIDEIVPSKYHKMVWACPQARPHGPKNGQKNFFSLKIFFSRTKTGRVKKIWFYNV
jgi:hypothetical protein